MTGISSTSGSEEKVQIPSRLPVLPLRDLVVFPMIIAPLSVARESSVQAVDRALAGNRMILLVSQQDKDVEEPTADDLHDIGTVAVIMRMLKLPDGRIRVLVQGVSRARMLSFEMSGTHAEADLETIEDGAWDKESVENEAIMRSTKKMLDRVTGFGKSLPSEVEVIAENLEYRGRLADLCASNLYLKMEEAQVGSEINC